MPFCLNLHAAYRCGHSGACCEQDWHIPVEPEVVQLIRSGRLSTGGAAFGRAARPPDQPGVPRDARGACVFFDADGGRLCRIHTAAGPAALPSACRHFPRVVLRDDRGVFVSLSHFCPTAARMLVEAGPPVIVAAPDALQVEALEGFEAVGALPPLLRPGLLMDLEGYGAWESRCVGALARIGDGEQALGVIAAATERIRAWRPGGAPLRDSVEHAFDACAAARGEPALPTEQRRRTLALLPLGGDRLSGEGEDDGETWARGVRALEPFARAVSNYLAARVFACQVAYEGEGLRTVVEWLRTCLAVLQREAGRRVPADAAFGAAEFVEAVRQADLVLMHQVDTRAFARRAARAVEGAHQ